MNISDIKSEDEFINPDDEVNELASKFSRTQLVCVNNKEIDLPSLILADEINGNEVCLQNKNQNKLSFLILMTHRLN